MKRAVAALTLLLSVAFGVLLDASPVKAASDTPICSKSSIARATSVMSSRNGLFKPMLDSRKSNKNSYLSGISYILTSDCLTSAQLAHEFGHYVTDLAGRYDGGDTLSASRAFTRFPNWIRTHSDPTGVERAAHCVGRLLGYKSVWTRCPYKSAMRVAKQYLLKAQLQSQEYEKMRLEMEAEFSGVSEHE